MFPLLLITVEVKNTICNSLITMFTTSWRNLIKIGWSELYKILSFLTKSRFKLDLLISREDARIQIIYTNVFHLFVSHCKHIPNAGVPLCNEIFACHPDNKDSHSGISGRWQTEVLATHREVTRSQRFGVTIKMYHANELTSLTLMQRHWCKVCHLFKAVTSHFDWLSFFFVIYTKSSQFKVYWLCGILQDKFTRNSEIRPYYNSEIHWFRPTTWFRFDAWYHFTSTFDAIVRVMLTLFTNKMVSLPVRFFLLNHIDIDWCQQTWGFW